MKNGFGFSAETVFCLLCFQRLLRSVLRRLFAHKNSEKRQARREKLFVCLAIILAQLCALASAGTANRIKAAGFAPLRHFNAFANKILRRFAGCKLGEVLFRYIAEQIFIRAIEITGVNISVAFGNELVRTVPHHSALLGGLAQEKAHPVIELAHADISVAHIVFNIKIKYFNQKIGILCACHIKLTLFVRIKRAQAGDKLQISEAF